MAVRPKERFSLNHHLSILNFLTSAHVDSRELGVMQRALFALSIGTVLAIMLRPSLAESAREDIAKLRWLEHADPAADFGRQVVQQHDTRFMSVYGLSFSTEFPGLPDTPAAHRLVEKREAPHRGHHRRYQRC